MGISLRIAVLLAIALSTAANLNGGEALQMQVSPAVSRAPALLTVRVTIDSAAENRAKSWSECMGRGQRP